LNATYPGILNYEHGKQAKTMFEVTDLLEERFLIEVGKPFSTLNLVIFQKQCVKFSGKKNMITCYHDNMITLS
jgi:hypothetical protein